MNILTIAYITEGKTDQRFLGNIIRKTFEELAFECTGQIEVYEPEHIMIKKDGFVKQVIAVSKKVSWANVICIHADADNVSDENTFKNKINPSIASVSEINDPKVCKNLLPIVPVQMTEAWMLADRDLLRQIIFTNKLSDELGLPARFRQIEELADPKQTIENAIRIACQDYPVRRKRINISELYTPISQRIDLSILFNLPSYQKFKDNARKALQYLNYLN